MFATDVASRGMDFPNIDWVIQMDCPEDTETYIHRIGRTARYRSKGNSLLLLDPSEVSFIELLKEKTLLPKQLHTKKTEDISSKLATLLIESPPIKYLAERAFVSYVKSLSLLGNKEVFNSKNYNLQDFAYSMGLASEITINFDEESEEEKVVKKSKLQKFKDKIKQKKQSKEVAEENNFLIKKEITSIDLDESIPIRVSKRQLKRFKPEGVQKGQNITKFDEEGNAIEAESTIDALRKAIDQSVPDANAHDREGFISNIKSKLSKEDASDKKEFEELMKERKLKKKMKKKNVASMG